MFLVEPKVYRLPFLDVSDSTAALFFIKIVFAVLVVLPFLALRTAQVVFEEELDDRRGGQVEGREV